MFNPSVHSSLRRFLLDVGSRDRTDVFGQERGHARYVSVWRGWTVLRGTYRGARPGPRIATAPSRLGQPVRPRIVGAPAPIQRQRF